jgi:dTMP kinase
VKPGTLIAFEGIDGSGKSTQVALLARALRERGLEVVETREPTDGPFGRRIREMAASGRHPDPDEELRWFVEDRREHVDGLIRPALAARKVVVTDRYTLSTVAYQGARGHDPQRLLAESELAFPLPDLALVLELAPREGVARTRARPGHAEPVFENEAHLERVAAILASVERPYVARIDARGSPQEVHARVLEVVAARLG